MFLAHNVVLQNGVLVRWKWLLDLTKGFSGNDVYHLFTASYHNNERVNTVSVWYKHVPIKVYLFIWCLFCNRLSTKNNLTTRAIIQVEANVCIGGCEVQSLQSALEFVVDLTSLRWVHLVLTTTFISLATLVGALDKVTRSLSLFGCHALGRYGMKRTIVSSTTNSRSYINCSIKPNCSPLHGSRLQ